MKKFILLFSILFLVPTFVNAESNTVKLSKCVDGDTARFIIDGKEYSTRFLAIDTPETKHPKKKVEPYGKEASNYTCNSLKKASKIVLEYDSNSTKEDKYGRRLAWVFVDEELLQKKYNSNDKRSYTLLCTAKGTMELEKTYQYYLEPIYRLRKILGDEKFEALIKYIKEANDLMMKNGR